MMGININTVASIVQDVTGIVNIPLTEQFVDLGITNFQLQRIQISFVRNFNRTVTSLKFSDTVQSVTDRLISL